MTKNRRRWYSRMVPLVLLLLFITACTPIVDHSAHTGSSPVFLREELLLDHPGYVYQWSPTGRELLLIGPEPPTPFAYQPMDRPLVILDLSTGHTTELPKRGYSPLWSPDGSAILFSTGQVVEGTYHLWLYSVATAVTIEVAPLPFPPLWWLPNGRLVYEAQDGLWFTTLTLPATVDPTLQAVRLPPPQSWFAYDTTGYDRAAPLPDGETLFFFQYVAEGDVRYSMVRPDGSQQTFERQPEGIGTCCAESSDGSLYAVFSFAPQYGLYLVDGAGEKRRLLVAGANLGAGRFLSMAFAPDNRTLAFEWLRPGQDYFEDTQIYLVDVDGSNLRQLTPNESGSHRWLRWSPDGKHISFERPVEAGNTLIGLVQVQPVASVPTLPLTLPPLQASPGLTSTTSPDDDSDFLLRTGDACPQQLHFALPTDPAHKEQWLAWPVAAEEEPTPVIEWQGIPFYRLHQQGESAELTQMTIQTGAPVRLALHWSAEQSRWGTPSTTLTFSGVVARLAAPVTIMGPANEITSRSGITCQPPKPITIRGNSGWLLQQTAAPDALLPAINTVIWQEAGAYWRLSGEDVSSGGEYTGERLLQIAQQEVEKFVSPQEGWQPVK